MRASILSPLLLTSAATASFLDAFKADLDTATSITSPSAEPTAMSNSLLNEAFAPQQAHINLRAPHPRPTADAAPAEKREDEKREIVTGAAQGAPATAAAVAASQYPTITTQWAPVRLGGQVTWVAEVYTQTFAQVPDQWAAPGVGRIGYGDEDGGSSKEKEKRADSGAVMERPTGRFAIAGIGVLLALGAVVMW